MKSRRIIDLAEGEEVRAALLRPQCMKPRSKCCIAAGAPSLRQMWVKSTPKPHTCGTGGLPSRADLYAARRWVSKVPLADSCSATKWRGAIEFRSFQRSHANVRTAVCWFCGQLMRNIVWP
jgi:hypothetical protein